MEEFLLGLGLGLLLVFLIPTRYVVDYAEWLEFQDTIDDDNRR